MEDPKQRELRRLNKLINSLCTMDVVSAWGMGRDMVALTL